MGDVDIAERRRQMGKALREWACTPRMIHSVQDGSWTFLSGLPSADVNMALVHGGDPEELVGVIGAIDTIAAPALLMFAGDGLALAGRAGAGWAHVGVMPFMAADVASTPQQLDDRIRRAGREDADAIVMLWADAFGLAPDIAAPIVEATLGYVGTDMSAWLLEVDGQPMSTVTTSRVDDVVTIWCMATPERFARRGYGRALLADAMARAASAGVQVGLLGATPAGRPLYDATGWKTLEDWQIYTNGDSAQFH